MCVSGLHGLVDQPVQLASRSLHTHVLRSAALRPLVGALHFPSFQLNAQSFLFSVFFSKILSVSSENRVLNQCLVIEAKWHFTLGISSLYEKFLFTIISSAVDKYQNVSETKRNISHGSVATQLRCGGIFNNCIIANCPKSVPLKVC